MKQEHIDLIDEWTGGYLYKSGVKKVKAYGC